MSRKQIEFHLTRTTEIMITPRVGALGLTSATRCHIGTPSTCRLWRDGFREGAADAGKAEIDIRFDVWVRHDEIWCRVCSAGTPYGDGVPAQPPVMMLLTFPDRKFALTIELFD